MIASAQEKSFNQFGDAGLFCTGKLPPEGKRFLAQMQMDALNAHAHKLAIVGFHVKSRRYKTRMVLTTVFTMNLLGAPASRRPVGSRKPELAGETPALLGTRPSERAGGRQMPHGFGKKDECGFLPKAATPGWK